MIGSDEMSSTSMDISETFRPEDLSKTDFFDFVTAPDMGIGIGVVGDRPPGSNETNGTNDQPLQGYDQFWGSDKDHNRLETAIFEDLDRYCWQQSQTNTQQQPSSTNPSSAGSSASQASSLVGGISNTDGQIYTLTVLNGTEPWLKRDPDAQIAPALDLDSLLGSFPGYVKSEFVYEDSGFSTDNTKDDLNHQQQQQQQHQQHQPQATQNVVTTNSTNLVQYQNNNNDWHIADNNAAEQSSAESLLRSALQGKGYSKGLHLQNGIAIIPSSNSVKDEELRRALFSPDQDSLHFADSTLSTPIFDDTQGIVSSPTGSHHQPPTPQTPHTPSSSNCANSNNNSNPSHSTTAGIVVDDMFLSLETAFSDDFEKIKRIANEVQQFCSTSDYPEVIMEITTALPSTQSALQSLHQSAGSQTQQQAQQQQNVQPPPQPLKPEVTTSSNPTSTSTLTKSTAKKYKRSISNPNNNNNSSLPNNNSNHNSPTQCNGQRKERSLHYCSICSKGFKDKYSVNVHIRTHTGEKPFTCSLCGKSFRQKAHLAKHYQTHLAQKSNNVVKGGKQSQSTNNRHSQQTSTTIPSSSRPLSAGSASSGSLPPANGLLANR